MEEWKIIDNSSYSISNFGNVRNDNKNKLLKKSICDKGYYLVNIHKKPIRIHRLIGKYFIPNPNNYNCIDHKDGNSLNNSIENLRWCSHQDNMKNRKLSVRNSSGFQGVHYDKQWKKWRARIRINDKPTILGSFKNLKDAVKCRVLKAKEIFGDFLNEAEQIQYDRIMRKEKKKLKNKQPIVININIQNANININQNNELQEIEELERELDAIINN
jgi:hypothetical protein